ncbi:guanylate kinase [bacterium]|nr:guanylate kinase [bacterium]
MDKINKKYFVIAGPSGVGKTTIIGLVLKDNPNLQKVLTSTTREIRDGEVNGVNYNFYSVEGFQKKLANQEFLENEQVHLDYYGVEKKEVEKIIENNKIPLFEVDVRGVMKIKKLIPNLKTIFILPESLEQIENRLKKRPNITEEKLKTRLETARNELKIANEFDYQVVNREGKIDETVNKVLSIIEGVYKK